MSLNSQSIDLYSIPHRENTMNYYLLFNNKEPPIDSGDSHDVFTERDLCIERIKTALTELVVDYHVEFLRFIPENKELAEY